MCIELLSRRIDYKISLLHWNPITISRKGPPISHLFYAYDIILFSRANDEHRNTINKILSCFSLHSRQKINYLKSKVLFSNNCSPKTKASLARILNIQVREKFGKYLSFPIFHNKPTNRDFQFLVVNIYAKLAGWKIKFLNMDKRTILAKSSITSIPTHIMQFISIPSKILSIVDRCTINFIWGSTVDKKKSILSIGTPSPSLKRKVG